MQYIFEFSAAGEKSFLELPKDIRQGIQTKMEFFLKSGNPLSFAVPLTGIENKYRFRIGDYRVIFSRQKNGEIVILLILKVAHRSKVYE